MSFDSWFNRIEEVNEIPCEYWVYQGGGVLKELYVI